MIDIRDDHFGIPGVVVFYLFQTRCLKTHPIYNRQTIKFFSTPQPLPAVVFFQAKEDSQPSKNDLFLPNLPIANGLAGKLTN